MLWEVERILKDCKELPQVLIMENVPQVHGKKNKADFDKWCEFLESMGYTNSWQDLNAKDYGIPQNRNRCFMVSILHGEKFVFPEKQELKLKLKDLLEDTVDEKFYLSPAMKTYIADQCNLKEQLCTELIEKNLVKEYDVVNHSYSTSRMNNPHISNSKFNDTAPTLQTRCDTLGVVVNANKNENLQQQLRIRKLTPKECFRLMGVKDEDFEKIARNQSNASLFHLAGDSICTPVLVAIFGKLLGIDYKTIVNNFENWWEK